MLLVPFSVIKGWFKSCFTVIRLRTSVISKRSIMLRKSGDKLDSAFLWALPNPLLILATNFLRRS